MKALKTDYANFREVLRTMPPEPYHTPADIDCRMTPNVGALMAVANGKVLGRPKGRRTRPEKRRLYGCADRIVQLRGRGVSFCGIARLLKVSKSTLSRYISEAIDDETKDLIGFGGARNVCEQEGR